jgi:hypothetical protein
LIGAVLVYFNYVAYTPVSVGYWIADGGRLEIPGGYFFLISIFVFYAILPFYIVRSICISLFLGDLVERAKVTILPFHPDRSGGLRPVGRIGLRNQYALTVCGLNVVSLVTVSFLYLVVPPSLVGLIVAAAVAYAALGPVVFLGPLLPFRSGMLRTKSELMSEIATRLQRELERLRLELPAGKISKEDEELVERLRKVGAVVDQLPVWPFDAGTLQKFLTAYCLPIVGAVGYPMAKTLIGIMVARVRVAP